MFRNYFEKIELTNSELQSVRVTVSPIFNVFSMFCLTGTWSLYQNKVLLPPPEHGKTLFLISNQLNLPSSKPSHLNSSRYGVLIIVAFCRKCTIFGQKFVFYQKTFFGFLLWRCEF